MTWTILAKQILRENSSKTVKISTHCTFMESSKTGKVLMVIGVTIIVEIS